MVRGHLGDTAGVNALSMWPICFRPCSLREPPCITSKYFKYCGIILVMSEFMACCIRRHPIHDRQLRLNVHLVSHGPRADFSGSTSGKESACYFRRGKRFGFDPWVGTIPWSRKWQPTLVFLPGKFHAQRSLVGYSPWGPKELVRTEPAHTHTHGPRVSWELSRAPLWFS